MAQLVFSTLGQSAGSALLPNGVSVLGQQISGAAIGQFVGSVAGAAVDSYLFAPRLEGPRVNEIHVTESREGGSIPNVYGRVRVGGNVIWAARFKEKKKKEGGGKGGPSLTTYSYSLSFAVALCEGEISRVSRVWANGEIMDVSAVNWRLYKGSADQLPDALIEAVEGSAPAYRGLAYVVFEDLPLDAYGMRMPQLSFEVIRSVARHEDEIPRMEEAITSVNLIPGSGEFVYAGDIVRRIVDEGEETPENMHNGFRVSNFEASIDQALADLPNLKHVNLVVGWFGNDLRCGTCQIKPGVEIAEKVTSPLEWKVAGVHRGSAYLISQDEEGRPYYGGTPDDQSVLQAIQILKARGLKITLYPFLFMDVPKGNGLPDPYGGAEQAAFPWRGRITCSAGLDSSEAAGVEVSNFFGQANAADFSQGEYAGAEDWRYRRFVLHYANLVKKAGGVDAFLIGAEMVALSHVRSERGVYPAAMHFADLATQVRSIVGNACQISYAADWTEYGAFVPADGLNDTDFPLDQLWASQNIDFIGVDWYPPMSDWRAISGHVDEVAGWKSLYDPLYLASNIEGGEGYDWYYASSEDRAGQIRTPILDGGYGEDWTYRQKDIRNWQKHAHFPRKNGVKEALPTAWMAGSKPIRFVEFGCSAVDMGPNQPNVFYDPKSSENALPHYSSGMRDDIIQRQTIETFCQYWKNDPLLDMNGISIWAWDARPFPAWPTRSDIWGDGDNWNFGHWLNGRVGLALLKDVVSDLARMSNVSVDVTGLQGLVQGYSLDRSMSLRDSLEPLKLAYGIECVERENILIFTNGEKQNIHLDTGDFVQEHRGDGIISRAFMEKSLPVFRLKYIDAQNDYQAGIAIADAGDGLNIKDVMLPLVLDESQALDHAREFGKLAQSSRNSGKISLSLLQSQFECGDRVLFGESDGVWRIEKSYAGDFNRFDLIQHIERKNIYKASTLPAAEAVTQAISKPHIVIVDGPILPNQEDDSRPLVFGYAQPWNSPISIKMGSDESLASERAILTKPSILGRLVTDLPVGENGRWLDQSFEVKITSGILETVSELGVLNGENGILVETLNGWELLQFQNVNLLGDRRYKLSRFLRAQQGTDSASSVGALAGAQVIFLTGDETRLDLKGQEVGLNLVWSTKQQGASNDLIQRGSFVWEQKALRQWSPCHLKAAMQDGDLMLNWVRRSRIDGDIWRIADKILAFPEIYQVRILGENGVERVWQTNSTNTVYPSSQILEDFPVGGLINIQVGQIGEDGILGHLATILKVI